VVIGLSRCEAGAISSRGCPEKVCADLSGFLGSGSRPVLWAQFCADRRADIPVRGMTVAVHQLTTDSLDGEEPETTVRQIRNLTTHWETCFECSEVFRRDRSLGVRGKS
jgi:hypothetical protein